MPVPPTKKKSRAVVEMEAILDCLVDGKKSLSAIMEQTGLPVYIAGTLMVLEMHGAVRRLPGDCYELQERPK